MKIVVSLLLLATLNRAFSDTSTKDGYGGQSFLPSNKRETLPDDHGGKGIGGVQYVNTLGPIGHYVTAQTAQPHYSKYDLGLTYAPNNYRNAYQDQVPYPGVYQHQSKYGPIQYAAPSHQAVSYQQPVHMILASYHPNSLHYSKGGGGPLHYSPAPQFGIFASTAPLNKYPSAPHNSILPQTQVVHIAAQQQSQPQHQHSIYTGAPSNAQSQHAVLTVQQQQYVAAPVQQQQYVAAQVHQQPQQFHQQQRVVSSQPQPTAVAATPQQYYAAAQPIQAPAYHHQQPSYSYSIQPSIQIAASKQIVAPADPTPQYKQVQGHYSNDGGAAASYVSLVRQYSATPTQVARAGPLAQQVFYPTPSTPVYSTARPLLGPIGHSGSGATPDYSSGGIIQYGTHLNHPHIGKSAAISASKYT